MLKKTKKFGIGKFLVMALVLGGGLVYGTQMVQKNQENRSSAAGTQILPCRCSKSVYKTANLCKKARGIWTCPTITKVPARNCSNSDCGSCFKPTECNNAGCRWDSKANTCIKKSVTPITKNACTSVVYSTWSPCRNGIQTRSIFEKNPSDCTVENPMLRQVCSDIPKPTSSMNIENVICTSVIYDIWSPCKGGTQTRGIFEKNPSGCTVENPVLSQSCSTSL